MIRDVVDRRVLWPRWPQEDVLKSDARFKVWVAGRRTGKTTEAGMEIIKESLRVASNRHGRIWYIGPTHRQAKDAIWNHMKSIVSPYHLIGRGFNNNNLSFTFRNGVQVELRGALDPDSLRGPGLDLAILDEYANMDPYTWKTVLRPMLSDEAKPGRAVFIGTPQGYNHFYDLYMEALAGKEGWQAFHHTTAEGGNVAAAEIESAKRDMSERQWKQEYLASFENLAGRVYYNFEMTQNVAPSPFGDQWTELYVGMDFNVNPMTAVAAVRFGDTCFVIDEWVLENSNTTAMMQAIHHRYPVGPGRPINIVVYPDPTGSRRSTNAPVGMTDHRLIRESNYNVRVWAPHAPYARVDRLNTVNAMLCNALGQRRLFVHPRCLHLIKALNGFTYREGTSVLDETSPHIHITDALGYMIMGQFPILRQQTMSREFI